MNATTTEPRDVTERRLDECRHATEARFDRRYTFRYPRSIPNGKPLTQSEARALDLLPLSLEDRAYPGAILSKGLLYSSAMKYRPKAIRQAMFNLLIRGRARVLTDGRTEWIAPVESLGQ